MRRIVIAAVAVVVVAGVVVAIVLATRGGGSGKHPSAQSTSPSSSAPHRPPRPSACTFLPNAAIEHALHVRISGNRPATSSGRRTCTWRTGQGDAVTVTVTDSAGSLLLQSLATLGARKVGGLGHTAIFAPKPPRLALAPGGAGVTVQLDPAGYQRLLPKGTTNPARIPSGAVLAPLTAMTRAVLGRLPG